MTKGKSVNLVVGLEKSSPIVGIGHWKGDPINPPQKGDEFGTSLAVYEHDVHKPRIDGRFAPVAVGAPADDTGGTDAGAAYVY